MTTAKNRTSRSFRKKLIDRDAYEASGRWGVPFVRNQGYPSGTIGLVAYPDTRRDDVPENTRRGVHFFVDDPRFEGVYRQPERSAGKLAQYAFVLTPDFSLYAEMKPWEKLASVAKNRWCGSYWQSKGMHVVPTVSWGTPETFEYCFDGIERHAPVAVGMVGCKRNRAGFMRGYDAMMQRLEPSHVLVFGDPFPEMEGVTDVIDYRASRKVVR